MELNETQVKDLLEKVKLEAKASIEESLKGYVSNEELENIKGIASKAATSEELETLKTAINGIAAELKATKEESTKGGQFGEVSKNIREKEESFKSMFKSKSGSERIETKAFSQAGSFNPSFQDFIEPQFVPGIARTPDVRERFNILNYVTTGRAFSEIVKWVEEESEAGTANFIAECVAKPDVSKVWKRASTEVRKVADFTKVCDEVLMYVEWAEQEIRLFLNKMVYIAIQDAILNGDGTGENLNGIIPQASAFVAGAKAASVFNANRSDAVAAAVSQINSLGFMASHVLMNSEDIYVLQTTKDLNGNYLVERLGGVTLVDCPFITAGNFLVGDMAMSNVRFYQDITVDMGLNGEDFRENSISLRGEAFLAHYIASNHTNAFVYDTFTNVITLINKP